MARDDREHVVAQIARRRPHFELRFARDDVHARLESAVGAVISNLDRDIEGDAERHGRDVEAREQRMLREVAEDVPAKETGILRDQVVNAEDAEKSTGCELVWRRTRMRPFQLLLFDSRERVFIEGSGRAPQVPP